MTAPLTEGPAEHLSPAWERLRRPVSLAALLLVNTVPLIGVFAWGWDAAAIVILYWSENLIIGALNIVKMLVASPVGGIFMSLFFLVHYGGFCAVHGMFVLSLTDQEDTGLGDMTWPFLLVFVELLVNVIQRVLSVAPIEWIVGFVALALSHSFSLVVNYFLGGEYRHKNTGQLMGEPYGRVMIMHFAVILGALAVTALGEPVGLLLVLIALKVVIDVLAHRREHRERPAPAPTGPEAPAA